MNDDTIKLFLLLLLNQQCNKCTHNLQQQDIVMLMYAMKSQYHITYR